jgi:hypothetical protein
VISAKPDQTAMHGFPDSASAPHNCKFFQQAFDVGFDRSFGNKKLHSDFFIAFAGRNALKDFDLTWA